MTHSQYPMPPQLIRTAVIGQVSSWLTRNGLKLKNTAKPVWDPQLQCWEWRLHLRGHHTALATKDGDQQAALDGRSICLRFYNDNSRTYARSQHYQRRIDHLIKTAAMVLDLPTHRVQGTTKQNLCQDKLRYLQEKYHARVISLKPERSDQHGVAIQEMASLLVEIEELISSQSPSEFTCLEEYMLEKDPKARIDYLYKREAEITSKEKRAIEIAVYPAGVDGAMWINFHQPFTNISSALRTGEGNVVPNWYQTEDRLISAEGQVVSKSVIHRSASIKPLKIHHFKKSLLIAEHIEKKRLRTLARNQVIRHLNLGRPLKQLDNALSVTLNAVSLLSPFQNIGEESEYEQLLTWQTVLKRLSQKELRFTNKDLAYIRAHVSRSPHRLPAPVLEALLRRPIRHRSILTNFGVNFFRGSTWPRILRPLVWLLAIRKRSWPFDNLEQKVNQVSRKNFADLFLEKNLQAKLKLTYAQRVFFNNHTSIIKSFLKKAASGKLYGGLLARFFWRTRSFEVQKKQYLAGIRALYKEMQHTPDDEAHQALKKQYQRIYERACYFYRYIDYSFNPHYRGFLSSMIQAFNIWRGKESAAANSERHNYQPALFAQLMGRSLGMETTVACKSGEDRTGAQLLISVSAQATIYQSRHTKDLPLDKILCDQQYFEDDKNGFLSECWNSFKKHQLFSGGRKVCDACAPGAYGYQISNNTLPKEARVFATDLRMAKIHKVIFDKAKKLIKKKPKVISEKPLSSYPEQPSSIGLARAKPLGRFSSPSRVPEEAPGFRPLASSYPAYKNQAPLKEPVLEREQKPLIEPEFLSQTRPKASKKPRRAIAGEATSIQFSVVDQRVPLPKTSIPAFESLRKSPRLKPGSDTPSGG